MRLRSVHLASSSVEHGSLLLGLGALASLILVLASAPAWVFYLAPALAIPLAIRAFEAQAGRSGHASPRIGRKRLITPEWASAGPQIDWAVIPVLVAATVALVELVSLNPFVAGLGVGVLTLLAMVINRLVNVHLGEFELSRLEVRHLKKGELDLGAMEEEAERIKLLVFHDDSGSWVVGKPSGEPISAGHPTREAAERAAVRCLRDLDGGYMGIEDQPPPSNPRK